MMKFLKLIQIFFFKEKNICFIKNIVIKNSFISDHVVISDGIKIHLKNNSHLIFKNGVNFLVVK